MGPLENWASAILLVFVVLGGLIVVGLFAVIALTLRKVEQQVEKLTNMAEPLVAKATNTLDTVQRITENVGEKADSILTKGEALTDDLAVKVGQTSTVVQKTVTNPLINLSSVLSGLSAGFSVWKKSASAHAKATEHTVPGYQAQRNGTSAPVEETVAVMSDGI